MLVSADFNYFQPSPLCKCKIKYTDSNSKIVEVSFDMNGLTVDGNMIDKNNNHCFKVSFTENNKTNDVVFKIPKDNILDKMFITSAITYVYLNTTDNLKIEPDKITINIVETDRKNNKKGVFGETMLEKLDSVKIVFEEEPSINSLSQSSEIIDNDMQSQQGGNNVEEQSVNDVGSHNLNNNILPECCNNCITGLQNLWNKIKCW